METINGKKKGGGGYVLRDFWLMFCLYPVQYKYRYKTFGHCNRYRYKYRLGVGLV